MECFKHTWQERKESYCKQCHIKSLEQEIEFLKKTLYELSKVAEVEISYSEDW